MTEDKKPKLLLVDDDKNVLKTLRTLCNRQGFITVLANNGNEAIEQAMAHMPDLIITDIQMPQMDGFELIKELKKDPLMEYIPVIVITGFDTHDDKLKAIRLGASDFITKPYDAEEVELRINNNLKIKEYHDFLKNYNDILSDEVEKKTHALNEALKNIKQVNEKVKNSYIETIYRLSRVCEYKDEETATHIKRTSFYCKFISEKLGLPRKEAETIYYAAPMHDIGKVGVSNNILLKKAPLTETEWEEIKKHSEIGYKILKGSSSRFLNTAAELALTHHEKWDGSGYPRGLKAEKIPVSGQIMLLADIYDALRSHRPYKEALDHQAVFSIITRGSADKRTVPAHFNPEILSIFEKYHNDFADIYAL